MPTDDLLLQASQLFVKEEEEDNALLLAASQQYQKRCGPLMSSEDIQSAVLAQVLLKTKGVTTGQPIRGKPGPLDATANPQPSG